MWKLILLLCICGIYGNSNTTFDSMKEGLIPINDLGNGFLSAVRGPADPDKMDVSSFANSTISLSFILKHVRSNLGISILITIAFIFIVLMPIVGIMFCLCRYCGKCGGKLPAMDPPNARCKRGVYAVILLILVLTMLFGVILSLMNNQVVHESIATDDRSVNLFLRLNGSLRDLEITLDQMKMEIENANTTKVQTRESQMLRKDLTDAIMKFYKNLLSEKAWTEFIKQTQNLNETVSFPAANHNKLLSQVNHELSKFSQRLENVKKQIKSKIVSCTENQCASIRNQTDRLAINEIDKGFIDHLLKLLNETSSQEVKDLLQRITQMSANVDVDIKMIMESPIKRLTKQLNDPAFSSQVRSTFAKLVDGMKKVVSISRSYMPKPAQNSSGSSNHVDLATVRSMESYRYFGYLGLLAVLLLIVLFYLVGLGFGICGQRYDEDADCCNRGIGANFLMTGLALSFFFASILMIVVLMSMLSFGMIQLEFCRHTSPDSQNGPLVLDAHIKAAMELTNQNTRFSGLLTAILRNSKDQNMYQAFSHMVEPMLKKALKPNFEEINKELVDLVTSRLNVTEYLHTDPFKNAPILDPIAVYSLLSMHMSTSEFSSYQILLKSRSSLNTESKEMSDIKNAISDLQTQLQRVYNDLISAKDHFKKWHKSGEIFNHTMIKFVNRESVNLLDQVEQSLFEVVTAVLNRMFYNVRSSKLRLSVLVVFDVVCKNGVNFLNGVWFGLGIFVLLLVPAIIFAGLLISLYRRVQAYYPDKPEPDYDNYIGFYARADGTNSINKAPVHRGYRPIPLQSVS